MNSPVVPMFACKIQIFVEIEKISFLFGFLFM